MRHRRVEAMRMASLPVVLALFLVLLPTDGGADPDLPNAVANNLVIPTSSLVIAMDSSYQIRGNKDGSFFYEKAYGLIADLLSKNIPVQWVIPVTKSDYNDVDLSVLCDRVEPTSDSMGTCTFKGGPFVIDVQYRAAALSAIQAYNTRLVSNAHGAVDVYTTLQDTTGDVRYNLTAPVNIGISKNDDNGLHHRTMLTQAGFNVWHYQMVSPDILKASSCFTTWLEDHRDTARSTYAAVNDYLNAKGNLLAQCSSVLHIESELNLQTTAGLTASSSSANLRLRNPNTPLAQIAYHTPDKTISGYPERFVLDDASSYRTNVVDVVSSNGANRRLASMFKTTDGVVGGVSTYLGGHSWLGSDEARTATRRLFYNALFIPRGGAVLDTCVDVGFPDAGSIYSAVVVTQNITHSTFLYVRQSTLTATAFVNVTLPNSLWSFATLTMELGSCVVESDTRGTCKVTLVQGRALALDIVLVPAMATSNATVKIEVDLEDSNPEDNVILHTYSVGPSVVLTPVQGCIAPSLTSTVGVQVRMGHPFLVSTLVDPAACTINNRTLDKITLNASESLWTFDYLYRPGDASWPAGQLPFTCQFRSNFTGGIYTLSSFNHTLQGDSSDNKCSATLPFNIVVSADLITAGDAGDLVSVNITITHATTTTDLYQLYLQDLQPVHLIPIPGSLTSSMTPTQMRGNTSTDTDIELLFDRIPISVPSVQVRYQARINESISTKAADKVLQQDVTVRSGIHRVDKTLSHTINMTLSGGVALLSTSDASTGSGRADPAVADVVAGEAMSLLVRIVLREGTSTFMLKGTATHSVTLLSSYVTSVGANIASSAGPVLGKNGTAIDATRFLELDLGTLVTTATAGVVHEVQVAVTIRLDDTAAGMGGNNGMQLSFDIDYGVDALPPHPIGTLQFDVLGPALNITTSLLSSFGAACGDAGDDFVFATTVAHTAQSTYDAVNVTLSIPRSAADFDAVAYNTTVYSAGASGAVVQTSADAVRITMPLVALGEVVTYHYHQRFGSLVGYAYSPYGHVASATYYRTVKVGGEVFAMQAAAVPVPYCGAFSLALGRVDTNDSSTSSGMLNTTILDLVSNEAVTWEVVATFPDGESNNTDIAYQLSTGVSGLTLVSTNVSSVGSNLLVLPSSPLSSPATTVSDTDSLRGQDRAVFSFDSVRTKQSNLGNAEANTIRMRVTAMVHESSSFPHGVGGNVTLTSTGAANTFAKTILSQYELLSIAEAPPNITSFVANDPDDLDRVLSSGDTVTISFDVNTNQVPVSSTSEITKILAFNHGHLGSSLSGTWVQADTLVITVLDATGATASLQTTTVSIKPGSGVKIESGASKEANSTSPPLTGDFGRLGPQITGFTVSDPDNGDVVYGNGDRFVIAFDIATSQPAVASDSNVRNLLTFSQNPGAVLSGAWISPSELAVVVVDATSAGSIAVGSTTVTVDNSTVALRGAPAYPITLNPSLSMSPVLAGNFGQMVAPKIIRFEAVGTSGDDVYSNGDRLVIEFDLPTNQPDISSQAKITTVFTLQQGASGVTLGTAFSAAWTSPQIATITVTDVTGAAPTPIVGQLAVSTVSDRVGLQSGLPVPSGVSTSGTLAGNWGTNIGPVLTSAVFSDPGSDDTVYNAGDTLTITFNMDTNAQPVSTKVNIDTLFSFTSPLGVDYTAAWTNGQAKILVITIVTPVSVPSPQIGSFVVQSKSSGNIRDAGETLPSSSSSVLATGDFGILAGPQILQVICSDPDNADAMFGDFDVVAIVFDKSTNALPASAKMDLDRWLVFTPSLGTDYTGRWTQTSTANDTLVVTIVNSTTAVGVPRPRKWWAKDEIRVQVKTSPNSVSTLSSSLSDIQVWQLRDASMTTGASTSLSPFAIGDWGTLASPSLLEVSFQDINKNLTFDDGDAIDFTFSQPTNQPNLSTTAQIDEVFSWYRPTVSLEMQRDHIPSTVDSASRHRYRVGMPNTTQDVGSNYTATWVTPSHLRMTFHSVPKDKDNPPTPGMLFVSIQGTIRNAPVTSLATSAHVLVTRPGPTIISAFGQGGRNLGNTIDEGGGYGSGDHIIMRFDMDTNVPHLGTKREVDRVVVFNQSIGQDYYGNWTSPDTVILTITKPEIIEPQLGALVVTLVKGGRLLDARELSNSGMGSTMVYGSWTSSGSSGVTGGLASTFTRLDGACRTFWCTWWWLMLIASFLSAGGCALLAIYTRSFQTAQELISRQIDESKPLPPLPTFHRSGVVPWMRADGSHSPGSGATESSGSRLPFPLMPARSRSRSGKHRRPSFEAVHSLPSIPKAGHRRPSIPKAGHRRPSIQEAGHRRPSTQEAGHRRPSTQEAGHRRASSQEGVHRRSSIQEAGSRRSSIQDVPALPLPRVSGRRPPSPVGLSWKNANSPSTQAISFSHPPPLSRKHPSQAMQSVQLRIKTLQMRAPVVRRDRIPGYDLSLGGMNHAGQHGPPRRIPIPASLALEREDLGPSQAPPPVPVLRLNSGNSTQSAVSSSRQSSDEGSSLSASESPYHESQSLSAGEAVPVHGPNQSRYPNPPSAANRVSHIAMIKSAARRRSLTQEGTSSLSLSPPPVRQPPRRRGPRLARRRQPPPLPPGESRNFSHLMESSDVEPSDTTTTTTTIDQSHEWV